MITTTLRIDEETYNKLIQLANEEERSINSQIIYILKKYIENNSEQCKEKETINNYSFLFY